MSSHNTISILVDYRETNAALLKGLDIHPIFNPIPTQLKTGDFKLEDLLLIERKTWSDFAMSLIQGRLFRQAMRLTRAVHDRTVEGAMVIIEGPESDLDQIRISREAILGAITSLQIRFFLPVFRTLDPTETIKQLEIIYHQWSQNAKETDRTFPPRFGKFNRRNRRRNQIFVLQGLPGVGATRARDLLDHFGGVRPVFEATVSDLMKVPGIGQETAIHIRKLLDP